MNEKVSWNPVLNKFIEIKYEYLKIFNNINYSIENNKTCIEIWVEQLYNSNPTYRQYIEYKDLIKPLQFCQYNDLLLIRYGNYSDIFGGEEDITPNEFWDKYDGFYYECRSVVIDIKCDELVLTPFRKFRNLDECKETSYDNILKKMKNAHIIEYSNKLDGSMQSATFYNGEIVMSGSQSLNPDNSWRLQDGYDMLYDDNAISLVYSHPNFTFIFEYISLKDAHVVKYTKDQEGLYLIGVRDKTTGEEFSYEQVSILAKNNGVKTTILFDTSLDNIISSLDDKSSDEAEGFVMNIDDFKVKIKYNDYVKMHKVLSKLSSVNLIIKNIADNTYDDFISKIPDAYKDYTNKIASQVFNYIKKCKDDTLYYFNMAPKNLKKDFMIWVDNNVPKKYNCACKCMFFNQDINYIKSKSGKYLKAKDMLIEL